MSPWATIAVATILVPSHVVKSLQLIWRSGTLRWSRFHLWVPHHEMSCRVLDLRRYNSWSSSSNGCQVNSSPPSVAYMLRWTWSALVQVVACRLLSTKSLPEPILGYYTPRTTKLLGVYWFYSAHPSARPSRILCPFCSAYRSLWIHFIFIHLITQLQKVCCV